MRRLLNMPPMCRDERGATIVEFALILIPLCVMLMGSLELGYRVYAQAILTGTLREASRMASTGSYTGTAIDTYITESMQNFRSSAPAPVIDKRSYADFTGVGTPEPVTSGTVASGNYCYLDVNGNGNWDQDQGKAGLGGAEDIIYYEVRFSYPSFFPFLTNKLGFPETTELKANTIVSNEPYALATRTTPKTICR